MGSETTTDHAAATAMLDAMVSVGAEAFDVTWISRHGAKVAFCREVSPAELKDSLPGWVTAATARRINLIVRPLSSRTTLIQLDDLTEAALNRVRSSAFLGLETSPCNFQAWVALPADDADKDFARRLRKGVGADETASGATRIAGSLNIKEKYAPDFPRVGIVFAAPGVIANPAQLEALGLVAPPEPALPAPKEVHPVPRAWPDYQRCVERAPVNRDGIGPDRSRADFTWCLIAIDWGWSVGETAARLIELSEKARENGEGYARRTARNAAEAIKRTRRPTR